MLAHTNLADVQTYHSRRLRHRPPNPDGHCEGPEQPSKGGHHTICTKSLPSLPPTDGADYHSPALILRMIFRSRFINV
jgi:hypothetical protein